ncbi:uncharacterized protein GLRG_11372 [Colletotrichum graminicola M1.001]|uniref:Uncharacterized protein n=1 Tax=Colletotrichum graminicola (strain M1.001 / M2 / FGSC 10212) TaxID=645133 RepID=E3QZD9_COLGM|nr:uncharacterized protein GLRG_11372 [Colletotrichum graminicola M1.001]EFQ36227.1 hypothetical protein GLRG_11372 [Colletotrichum graminicola M1.001]
MYFDAYNTGGVQHVVSFEEKRLDDYKDASAFTVYKILDFISKIPKEYGCLGRAMYEWKQNPFSSSCRDSPVWMLHTVGCGYYAARICKGRDQTQSDLSHYAPYKAGLRGLQWSATSPQIHGSILCYKHDKTHNTHAELVPLFTKYPDFLRDVMAH